MSLIVTEGNTFEQGPVEVTTVLAVQEVFWLSVTLILISTPLGTTIGGTTLLGVNGPAANGPRVIGVLYGVGPKAKAPK